MYNGFNVGVLLESGQEQPLELLGGKINVGLHEGTNVLILIVHHERGDESGKSFTINYDPNWNGSMQSAEPSPTAIENQNECSDYGQQQQETCNVEGKGEGHKYCENPDGQKFVWGDCSVEVCNNGSNNPPQCDNQESTSQPAEQAQPPSQPESTPAPCSSDSDFTRLATRLREAGMNVIGIGEKKNGKQN